MYKVLLIVLICLLIPLSSSAHKRVYRLDTGIDIPVFSISGSLFLGSELGFEVNPQCPNRCNPDSIFILDRWTSQFHSDGAARASDILLLSVMSLPLLYYSIEGHHSNYDEVLPDLTVIYESFVATAAITEFVKVLFHRPRPYNYQDGTPLNELQTKYSNLSFFSGHTSLAFSILTSIAYTFQLQYPESPWRYGVWAGSMLLGSCIGILRIAAGKHFPTDVLTGAIVGIGIGLLIPWLHQ